ncbi:MAG TPA: TonB-dependent receptor [Candidatus Solibacter sp.]|nr:TonB-dependent receptor [Candidatus Solibacter sp.]
MKSNIQTNWMVRVVATLMFLLVWVGAQGQTTTATLSGVVRDPSGAVVPQVKLTLRNTVKGIVRVASTDTEGRYSFTSVEPGTYELRGESAGFRTEIKNGVVLAVGGSSEVDIALQVGPTSEVVTVTGEAPLIEASKAEVSNVINQQAIESLPNIGRNFVDFVKLSSGVAPGRENTGGGAFKEPDAAVGAAAAPRLTFGGQSELNTKVLVDGADNTQNFTGLPRVTPSQEAAQEFRVVNNTFATEYGGAMGGFVNIVTKSGGNDLHGSGYYYGMNNAFNVQPLLTGPNPVLRQNQFGFTLGGPFKKDRTFWFANYEGQRRAESNKFSSVIFNNLAAINAVKSFYGLAPETTNSLRTNDYNGFLLKVDHNLSEKNVVAMRYNVLNSEIVGFLGGGGRASPSSSTARNNRTFDQSFVASDTAMLGSNKVNEAHFQWARRSFDFASVLKQPDLEVSNLLLTGKSTSDPDFYEETRLQLSDSFSLNLGKHALKMGADFNHLTDDSQWDLFFPARVIFPNLATFFNHTPAVFWFPFLSSATSHPGFSVPFTQDVPTAWQPFTQTSYDHNSYGFFFQDEWKAMQRLTLTYGVRYDFETYPSKFFLKNDLNNFQPRLGFAYAYSKKGVIRGGFGIFNDRLISSIGQTLDTAEWLSAGFQPNAPTLFPGISGVRGRFIQPTVGGPGATTATNNFIATGQVPNLAVRPVGFTDNLDRNLRTPYSEQASLKISHEIGGGVAVSVSYLYVHGLKIQAHTAMLNGVPTPGAVIPGEPGKPVFGDGTPGVVPGQNKRLFPELGDFFVKSSGGASIYHGATFEVEKRFSHGFSFHSSYSWSKTISNVDSVANLADIPETSLALERALSRQNVPQRYTLSFISEVPRSVRILHDFKFSSLLSLESGQPFNIFAGSDANHDGNPLSDRPGNLGRNSLPGPGYASFDMRVGRAFQLKERLRAELSGDMFNLFNRTNIKDLNTLYGTTVFTGPAGASPVLGFGTPRDAFNPFQFQFGVKLSF